MQESREILTPEERRKQRHEEMRETILEVAREMMGAEGAGALSWNEIARRVGLKPPSLYVYFDDKMAIYDALFRQGYEQYGALMAEVVEKESPGWGALRAAAEAHFRFCLENPDLFQIMFERPIPGFEPSPESLRVSFGELEKGRRHFAEMISVEEIEPDLPTEQAFDLWIALEHGLTAQHLANQPDLPLGEGRFGSLIPAAMDLFKAAWGREGGED